MINIITVNYPLNGDGIINTSIDGGETLLDADIVVFDPSEFSSLWNHAKKGDDNVRRLYSPTSDQIRNTFSSRRREVETLLENGKIIISFLHPTSGFKGEIGNESRYDIVSNYDFLPLRQDFFLGRLKSGTSSLNGAIKLNKSKSPFNQFFNAFKSQISYTSYFDLNATENPEYFILNKANKGIGVVLPVFEGLIVLLPSIEYERNNSKLVGVLRSCAKQFLTKNIQTPPPPWVKEFKLTGETELDSKASDIQIEIEKLQAKKIEIEEEKNEITQFKGLLFEQGNELEELVIKSFQKMGFDAENRKMDDLEHDVVFESAEGKGLAEIEGKDNDAVHISKLDQLNRAVDEDFELRGEYPQGILIGNHYRLTNPENRKEAFTEKVHIVAKKKSFGLLTTFEIFKAVQYILENPNDTDFKLKCRNRILKTIGKEIVLIDK